MSEHRLDAKDIAARLAGKAEAVCSTLLPEGQRAGHEWVLDPGAGKIKVQLTGAKAGIWAHFGGDIRGDLIDLVRYTRNCETRSAIRWARQFLGQPENEQDHVEFSRHRETFPDASERSEAARRIWRASKLIMNTVAETYLHGRGLTTVSGPSLRYHAALRHPDIGQPFPALIAAACDANRKITGVQRIFLTHDGHKAPINRPKLALGQLRGSAVRLSPATNRVWLTEGVEDALALIQIMNEPAWAALGCSGYRSIELPGNIKTVILAPDGDDAGQEAIKYSAARLAGQGREVRAVKLPAGKDWCDVLEDYDERAGILEFDMEMFLPNAETQARQEVLR